ncbi:MAG: YeiH family protein [Pigmentiphaga sp.]|uniref:YeiH family protein n=1 Tax=Pigmentiphaga sp. TaxID=1977564 RepID=UPI0029AAAE31|nr:YeiH family protein [Pigmentiphaga sp.]MDX3904734.1 YeiH family protein [Pigmentiphaga sp.]
MPYPSMSTPSVSAGSGKLAAFLRQAGPGLLLAGGLGAVAMGVGTWEAFASRGLSALTIAIVLGMLVGNTVYPRIADRSAAGVGIAKQTLLRAGVVLYGLRLTWQDIGGVGVAGVLTDAVVLLSTFGLAWLVGTRVFKLDRTSAWLIGAGSSICGAAAVMATAPVVRAKADQVAVAVATVVVFGTLAMFLYPFLYQLNAAWELVPGGARGFGVYVGSTVHEVAQVIAAARAVGTEAADTAVIAKMVRVMMLAPFLLALSAWLAWDGARQGGRGADRGGLCIPWFAVGFVAMVAFNSLVALPPEVVSLALDLDTLLLAIAMAGLGLTTHVGAIRRAGLRPLLLAAFLFGWLLGGGALVNRLFG